MNNKEIPVLFISLQVARQYVYIEKNKQNLSMPPLGMLYIISYLKQHGYTNMHFLDFGIKQLSKQKFIDVIQRTKPALIGINVYAETYSTAIQLSKVLKEILPDCKVIFGSAQATFTAEEMLTNSTADYVCIGEGETTVLELLEHLVFNSLKLSEIKGLVYKNDKEIKINPTRKRAITLDAFPFPDRRICSNYLANYMTISTLITTRGCPGRCEFCCSTAFWGKKVAFRSAENIYSEIVHLYIDNYINKDQRFGSWFELMDDSFTVNCNHINSLCEILKKSDLNLNWHCTTRLDGVNEEILATMQEAGCKHLQMGIESPSPEILKKINKNIDIDTLQTKIGLMNKFGFTVALSFIIGFPYDTVESINYTVNFIKDLWNKNDNIEFIGLAYMTPFPGTSIYEYSKDLGLIWKAKNYSQLTMYSPVVHTKNFSIDDLVNAFHSFQQFARQKMADLQSLSSKAPKVLD